MLLRCANTSLFSLASDAGVGAAPTPCYVVRAETSPFMATQKFVLCGGTNGVARLFAVGDDGVLNMQGTLSCAPEGLKQSRKGALLVRDVAFVDANTAAVCVESGHTALWDIRTVSSSGVNAPSCVFGNKQSAQAMCAKRDGYTIAIACKERLCLWDARKPNKVVSVYSDIHTDEVTCLAFANTHVNTLVSGSMDGLVCATDTAQAPDAEEKPSGKDAAMDMEDDVEETKEDDDDDDMEDGEYGELLDAVLSVEHPVERIEFLSDDDSELGVITCDECVSLWSIPTNQKIVDYDDIRPKLVYTDGTTMNHIVAVKKDRGTGANLVLATTDTGSLGMYALRGKDVIPLAASAPSTAAPDVAGHSELIRCATLCNHFVITGAEDARVCSWTTNDLPRPTGTSSSSSSAAAATAETDMTDATTTGVDTSSTSMAHSSYRPKSTETRRKHHGTSTSPY